jgi:hypothetical protein
MINEELFIFRVGLKGFEPSTSWSRIASDQPMKLAFFPRRQRIVAGSGQIATISSDCTTYQQLSVGMKAQNGTYLF